MADQYPKINIELVQEEYDDSYDQPTVFGAHEEGGEGSGTYDEGSSGDSCVNGTYGKACYVEDEVKIIEGDLKI